jgi:hypothetical protein
LYHTVVTAHDDRVLVERRKGTDIGYANPLSYEKEFGGETTNQPPVTGAVSADNEGAGQQGSPDAQRD